MMFEFPTYAINRSNIVDSENAVFFRYHTNNGSFIYQNQYINLLSKLDGFDVIVGINMNGVIDASGSTFELYLNSNSTKILRVEQEKLQINMIMYQYTIKEFKSTNPIFIISGQAKINLYGTIILTPLRLPSV